MAMVVDPMLTREPSMAFTIRVALNASAYLAIYKHLSIHLCTVSEGLSSILILIVVCHSQRVLAK